LDDHATHSPAARTLFEGIERGERKAWTSALVIAEIVFVLSSRQGPHLSPLEIRDVLLPLIELPGLQFAEKRIYRRVFDVYATHNVDFVDAYHVALIEARRESELYSFDKHFDRIPTLVRREP